MNIVFGSAISTPFSILTPRGRFDITSITDPATLKSIRRNGIKQASTETHKTHGEKACPYCGVHTPFSVTASMALMKRLKQQTLFERAKLKAIQYYNQLCTRILPIESAKRWGIKTPYGHYSISSAQALLSEIVDGHQYNLSRYVRKRFKKLKRQFDNPQLLKTKIDQLFPRLIKGIQTLSLTEDHIFPKTLGKDYKARNGVQVPRSWYTIDVCSNCNAQKGSRPFLIHLSGLQGDVVEAEKGKRYFVISGKGKTKKINLETLGNTFLKRLESVPEFPSNINDKQNVAVRHWRQTIQDLLGNLTFMAMTMDQHHRNQSFPPKEERIQALYRVLSRSESFKKVFDNPVFQESLRYFKNPDLYVQTAPESQATKKPKDKLEPLLAPTATLLDEKISRAKEKLSPITAA